MKPLNHANTARKTLTKVLYSTLDEQHFIEQGLQKYISSLQGFLSEVPSELQPTALIHITAHCEYDGYPCVDMKITYDYLESDEDFSKRIQDEK